MRFGFRLSRTLPKHPNLAVYLAAEPEGGGTHQYSLSIVSELALLGREGWSLTAVASDPTWRAHLPSAYEIIVDPRKKPQRLAAAAYRLIDRSPTGMKRSGRIELATGVLNQSQFDLIVFPGQDRAGAQVNSPSLVAVHDLMHRYESHFSEYGGRVYASRERRYRSISKFASGVLVDSDLGKAQFIESYGADPERIHVLPFVLPPYMAHARSSDVSSKYALYDRFLFYPAQLWEHKNHVRLIDAVALANRRGNSINLVLAGAPKNAYRAVMERIAQLDLEDCVKLLGYVPNEDMYSLYKGAVATVFVSLIGPTSIPPLEAMYVGSPLVLSRRYAMPEQAGNAALLVDPLNVSDIAEKITQVWTNAALRKRLSGAGQRRSAEWTSTEFGLRLRSIVAGMVTLVS